MMLFDTGKLRFSDFKTDYEPILPINHDDFPWFSRTSLNNHRIPSTKSRFKAAMLQLESHPRLTESPGGGMSWEFNGQDGG